MPKTRTFELIVSEPPDVVRQRLKAKTRFRGLPHIAPAFSLGREAPLGGWVMGSGFRVGLTGPDLLTRLQAVARGTLHPHGQGTRITGEVGLPHGITWFLRITFFIALALPAISGAAIWTETGSILTSSMFAVVAFCFVLLTVIASIGSSVAHADEQLDDLLATLSDATGADVAAEAASETTEQRQDAATRAARQGRQHEG